MNFKKILEYFDCTKYKRLYEIEREKREFFECQINQLLEEYYCLDEIIQNQSQTATLRDAQAYRTKAKMP